MSAFAQLQNVVFRGQSESIIILALALIISVTFFYLGRQQKCPPARQVCAPFVYKHMLPADKSDMTKKSICVLLVDPQTDFCDPKGSLCVPGAHEDSIRFANEFKKFSCKVSQVFVTLDTHQRYHIAHALFWTNPSGTHPKPFTTITLSDIDQGKWNAVNPEHRRWARFYVSELEKGRRFNLTIWPDHCLVGTKGHAVYEPIAAVLHEWEAAKHACVGYILKGNNAFTEHYSALKAEVPVTEDERTLMNLELIRQLKQYDRIVIAGQAMSHCVNFTIRDLVDEFTPGERTKIWIVKDGSSSVPGFEKQGDEFIQDMKNLGIRLVKSSEAFL